MKYYFGKVPAQDVNTFGDDGLFEHDGTYYYNQLEIGSNPGGYEDFVISDTCGRSIPISTDMIPGLARVLLDIKLMMGTIEEADALVADLADKEVVVVFE
jgi:hypothetical protein